jgi:hypothetical protein
MEYHVVLISLFYQKTLERDFLRGFFFASNAYIYI